MMILIEKEITEINLDIDRIIEFIFLYSLELDGI